jgi:hypothetical protein
MSKSTLGSGGDGALVFYRCRTVLVFSKSIKPIPAAAAALWKWPLAGSRIGALSIPNSRASAAVTALVNEVSFETGEQAFFSTGFARMADEALGEPEDGTVMSGSRCGNAARFAWAAFHMKRD